jgi:hypothetical protein
MITHETVPGLISGALPDLATRRAYQMDLQSPEGQFKIDI